MRRRTLTSGAWVVGGYLALNLVRLASNLILVRLLAREHFGLMAWIAVFLQGLQMFSDIGIGPAIIQNRRGEEERFLRTAFTMQVIRGLVLFLVGCALAWPMAWLYGIDQLALLMPVAAISALISGFRGTAYFRLNRHMRLGSLTLLELGRTLFATILMIVWAMHWPTVWAMLIPMVIGFAIETGVSHLLMRDRRDRFGWDRTSAAELFHFGKWVFLSTALTFFANCTDRLVFLGLFGAADLGVYYIAFSLAMMPTLAVLLLGQKVVFPAFAEVGRPLKEGGFAASEANWQRFRSVFARVRRMVLALAGLASAGLLATGPLLVGVLYPHEYAAAGWMLQLLAVGAWFQILEAGNGAAQLALGQPRWIGLSTGLKVASLALLLWLLIPAYGLPGGIAALVLSDAVRYLGSLVGLASLGIGLGEVWRDGLRTAAVGAVGLGGWWLSQQVEPAILSLFVTGSLVTAVWVLGTWREIRRLAAKAG